MERITFTNTRGEEVRFYASPYRLQTVEGLGDVEADIQTERSPFQDGDTFVDALLQPRYIDLQFVIFANNYDSLKAERIRLARVTNPKLGVGTLKYESGNITRVIGAIAESVPIFPVGRSNRMETRQVAALTFKCPNPYWKTEGIEGEPTFEPLFQFPFEGGFQMGIARDERIITNDGDAPVPFQVEFFGPAVNPVVTNETTGEFIKVNQTLLEGEYMRVDTTPGRKKVVFIEPDGTERNVFNWIDLESTLFQLIEGDNYLSYSADSDIQGAVVNFYYQQQYNSV